MINVPDVRLQSYNGRGVNNMEMMDLEIANLIWIVLAALAIIWIALKVVKKIIKIALIVGVLIITAIMMLNGL